MSRAVQITCDVCGKQKQQTNHWFRLTQSSTGRIVISPAGGGEDSEGMDLCGEACVLKKVSELIGK